MLGIKRFQGVWIRKCLRSLLKTDAVIPLVEGIFVKVPLKSHD
jgi:hypothetical protein